MLGVHMASEGSSTRGGSRTFNADVALPLTLYQPFLVKQTDEDAGEGDAAWLEEAPVRLQRACAVCINSAY